MPAQGDASQVALDLRFVNGDGMGIQIKVDPQTGTMTVGGLLFEPLQAKSEIEQQIAQLITGTQDHGNGYEWLYLGGLTFGGQSATLSLCFHLGRLEQAGWSVNLPDAQTEGGWPTREAIDQEITFVRDTLLQDGFAINDGRLEFGWGEMWCGFDAKGFLASSGLRYSAS